ncbi:MAG: ethanolamine ammonia-lyase subunit EutC [Sphingobium sp.]
MADTPAETAPPGWRAVTPARVALPRAGTSLGTAPVLALRAAHARARDAVHESFDCEALARAIAPFPSLAVHSEAGGRDEYLRRPDLGRRLHPDYRAALPRGPVDLALVCADGLSALAVQRQAPPFLAALGGLLSDLSLGPAVLAAQGRVAIADDVGEAMEARLAMILIGERPGLSVADSMGVYITFAPRRGRRDAERNCISNIHDDGLLPEAAAAKAAWLVRAALTMQCTGIKLKDEQPVSQIAAGSADQSGSPSISAL